MYRDVLQTYGMQLGDVPGSGFFWRAMARLERPIEFVAHMALTFEQANLDFASEYAHRFAQVGDTGSASVLQRVLDDEIRHVAFGARWLERWGEGGLLAAHERALMWPVTLGRARGTTFFEAPRLRAGLSPSYVSAIRTSPRPRGKPGLARWFNPAAEEEIAYGPGFRPNRSAREARADLAPTMLWLASPDDVVFVERPLGREFVDRLCELKELPRFAVVDFERRPSKDVLPEGVHGLAPWAASPRTQRWSAPLRSVLEPRRDGSRFEPSMAQPHRKSTAVGLLRTLLDRPERGWMPTSDVPRIARSMSEVEALLRRMSTAGDRWIAIKADLGVSGRGIVRTSGRLSEAERRAVQHRIEHDGAVVVEPWVDREVDLSFRLTRDLDGSVRVDHIGRFLTDARGQYTGAVLGRVGTGLHSTLLRFVHDDGRDPGWLERCARRVAAAIEADPAFGHVWGPIGVDAMVYRGVDGSPWLRPVVEVNPRHNMGHVAWALGKSVAPGRVGLWRIVSRTEVAQGDLVRWCRQKLERHPPRFEVRGRTRRLRDGVMPTTDPQSARRCIAMVSVAENLARATAALAGIGAVRTRSSAEGD
jgi:hypothetical protein